MKGAAEKVTGYTPSELEQLGLFEEVIHPDDRDRVRNAVKAGLEDGDGFDVSYRIVTADGEYRRVRDRGRLVTDPETGEEFIDGVFA